MDEPVSFRMSNQLLNRLDEHVERSNEYDARSQAIRHAVRELIDND